MNVIEALVVTLNLDAKGYTAGSKQATKSLKDTGDEAARVAKDMEARGAQAAQFFAKVRNEAISMLAVFTAGMGIKSFTENTVTSASNLGRLSDNLEMSTELLTAYQRAAERAGGTVEGMTAQIKESQQEVANYKAGFAPSAAMKEFFNQGGTEKDLKNGTTYMMARSKIIADLYKKNPGTGAFFAGKMGISEDTFNPLKQGPEAFLALVEAQKKHSHLSRQDAAELQKLNNEYLDFRDTVKDVATSILVKLAPTLEKLLDKFVKLAEWIEAHKDDIKQWLDNAISMIERFIASVEKGDFNPIIDGITGIGNALAFLVKTLGQAIEQWDKWNKKRAPAKGVTSGWWGRFGTIEDMDAADDRDGIKRAPSRMASGKIAYPSNPTSAARLRAKDARFGLPEGTLYSMWMQESGGGKHMLSPKGAKGHFQFMDATAKAYGLKDPYDFEESSEAAGRMMRDLMKQYGGNLQKSLAAYNGGSGNLAKYGMGGMSQESLNYIAQVTDRMGPRQTAGNTSTSTSEIHIQKIEINTQATDAAGIAQEIKFNLERNLLPTLSYRGGPG